MFDGLSFKPMCACQNLHIEGFFCPWRRLQIFNEALKEHLVLREMQRLNPKLIRCAETSR